MKTKYGIKSIPSRRETGYFYINKNRQEDALLTVFIYIIIPYNKENEWQEETCHAIWIF